MKLKIQSKAQELLVLQATDAHRSSRCTIIEMTGKRVIDLGGLMHRGKHCFINKHPGGTFASFFYSTVS